jgi:hypothetical protein
MNPSNQFAQGKPKVKPTILENYDKGKDKEMNNK